jgi:hypothetical protein
MFLEDNTVADYVRWCCGEDEEQPRLLDDNGAGLTMWKGSSDKELSDFFSAILWTMFKREGDANVVLDSFVGWVEDSLVVEQGALSWAQSNPIVNRRLSELRKAHSFGDWEGIGEPQHETLCGSYTEHTWHGQRCADCQAMLMFRKVGVSKETQYIVLGLDTCPKTEPSEWKQEYLEKLESSRAWSEMGVSETHLRRWLDMPPPPDSVCSKCRSPRPPMQCTKKHRCKVGGCTKTKICRKVSYEPCASCHG